MPPPWTDCRYPDLALMGMTNGINEMVWDKAFKSAAHGGQKAVKMFAGFDTTSSRGGDGHAGRNCGAPRRRSGHGACFERIIWLLVTAQIILQEVCAGSQPESTLLFVGCQKTDEQTLPFPGCSLPSPDTCDPSGAGSKLEPLGQH